MYSRRSKRALSLLLSLWFSIFALFGNRSFLSPVSTYAIDAEQQAFIENVGNAAKRHYSIYRILPSMTTAQAILESNWGRSTLASKYYNFFGMKAGSKYTGEKVNLPTKEEVNGELVSVDAYFRVYHSFDEGIEGYYQFITGYPWYSNLIGETDYKAACRKIREDGWATDSKYTSKLINLIEAYDLTRFDDPQSQPPVRNDCFPQCSSAYSSIVDALNSVGAESSYSYRALIAAKNGITGYSGTAEQNTQMLDMLKAGTLLIPTGDTAVTPPETPKGTYYPACSDSFASIVDALKSIGVDSSLSYRKTIAAANGISGYSGTAEQNNQMLALLKAGKLINPDGPAPSPTVDPTGKYYPACSSGETSIVDGLKSVGVDSSMSNRKLIAAANGISGYSGTAEQNKQMLSLLKDGLLIQAGWSEPPAVVYYTVSLNANGGTSAIASITVAAGGTYSGLQAASREGYTFDGWYTAASGGTKVTDGTSLVSAADHTLYAHWKTNTYTLILENNDGTGAKTEKTVAFGAAYSELPTPSRTGYTFAGWFTDIAGGTAVKNGDKHTKADNVTVYAHWKAASYTVSFDLNGGTGTAENMTVQYEGIYGALPTPSREGYTFDGWYTGKTDGTLVYEGAAVETAKNHTLYAHWTGTLTIPEETVTLKSGEQYTIKPSQTGCTYKSNNTAVAVVSKTGVVTALDEGSATISVIKADSDVVQLRVTVISAKVAGDCNGDGEITVSDAVVLQKWLLGSTKAMADWKAADLCEDGRLDAFDMIMMRRLIIENY